MAIADSMKNLVMVLVFVSPLSAFCGRMTDPYQERVVYNRGYPYQEHVVYNRGYPYQHMSYITEASLTNACRI
eukprot:1315755-Amorphochlora_amoeboformis.AAC.1